MTVAAAGAGATLAIAGFQASKQQQVTNAQVVQSAVETAAAVASSTAQSPASSTPGVGGNVDLSA